MPSESGGCGELLGTVLPLCLLTPRVHAGPLSSNDGVETSWMSFRKSPDASRH